ncbi:MAG: hypothetical protein DCC48_15220 [Acidobacteria bacterium]|nr:MAG: hypothetical protein DCC48_15220 [Acidobacteriota bacterium]
MGYAGADDGEVVVGDDLGDRRGVEIEVGTIDDLCRCQADRFLEGAVGEDISTRAATTRVLLQEDEGLSVG